tara:strand:- start:447 stop:692 length:246 start_codon:yes stop_codon:yes gene_type:complete
MLPPPQSLQSWRRRPCSQKLLPPQSLHLLRCRPCSHFFFTMPTTLCATSARPHVFSARVAPAVVLSSMPEERLFTMKCAVT